MNDRKVIRIIIFILVPLFIGFASYRILNSFFLEGRRPGDNTQISIEINKNENFKDICQNISNKDLVRHWKVLDIISRIRGRNLKLKVGEYIFNKSMSPIEIYETLKAGLDYKRKVVVENGMNINDISSAVDKAGIFKKELFIEKTKSRQILIQAGVRALSMEGYLSAGIYSFSKLGNPENLIWKMFEKSEKNWTKSQSELAGIRNSSRHDILTIASLIQKEVKNPKQYFDFSALIQNKVKAIKKLELESSLRYVIGNKSKPLTENDLKTDSPYNLFINTGLPPSPICTPSQKAISAALNPSLETYLDFIKLPDGTIMFKENTSKVDEEQN